MHVSCRRNEEYICIHDEQATVASVGFIEKCLAKFTRFDNPDMVILAQEYISYAQKHRSIA